MKKMLHGLAMCQSMFCAIPSPWNKIWDEEARGQMLLFLPLIGLEIGFLWTLLAWAVLRLGLPMPACALLLGAWPYVATGYLHLDGYMDVTDAVKSWRDLERRREILKDSHVGSFAVIGLALLLLAQFAFFCCMDAGYGILILIPVVSRCCSALAVKALKPMNTSQYASQQTPKSHLIFLSLMLAVAIVTGFMIWGRKGFALLGVLAGYGLALRRAYGSLEGMNGDVSGYALTIGELVGVAVMVVL